MYCKHCGTRLPDGAMFCQNCGAAVSERPSQQYQAQQPRQNQYQAQPAQQQTQGENTLAVVGFVLAFFVPIAGLICSILGYNKAKTGAPYESLAKAGIVLSAVFIAIIFIVVIGWLSFFLHLAYY